MTNKKLEELFTFYSKYLNNWGFHPRYLSFDRLEHCAWMCEQGLEFVQNNRIEKAMRWLGFIQGVLWEKKKFSLEELKKHSMP